MPGVTAKITDLETGKELSAGQPGMLWISGPNVMNIDLALSRSFRIRERQTVTFRAEAFNLPNSVMFGPPTAALNSTSFGRIAPQIQSTAPGTTTTARIMQFALKYAF